MIQKKVEKEKQKKTGNREMYRKQIKNARHKSNQ